jgi:archaellum component FlaC
MSEPSYVQSNKKEFHNVNIRNLSREDIRRLHEEMFKRQSYQIKRENLVVFCALACRNVLNLGTNIFVRFIDTEIVSFLEETGIINLVSKSNFSKIGDTFEVSSPHSKIISSSVLRTDNDYAASSRSSDYAASSRSSDYAASSRSTDYPGSSRSADYAGSSRSADYASSSRSANYPGTSSSSYIPSFSGSSETDSRIRHQQLYEEFSRRDDSTLLYKINDLEKECKRLFSLSQEKESTITRLSSELESKTKEYNSLFSSSEQLKEKISDLNTAVDYVTEEKNRADSEIMRLRNIIIQIEQNASQLQMKINRIEKMSNGNLSTINELTKQLDSMHQLYSSTSAQLTILQKKSTEFINRADQKEEENTRLLAEITLLKEENAFLLRKYKGEDAAGEDSTPKKRRLSNAGHSDD